MHVIQGMNFISNLYVSDIIINDVLKVSFNSKESAPLFSDQNVIFIAGFAGSGKSTLIKRLLENLTNFTEIPERRIITFKGIIEPYTSYFNLPCDFNKREERINIVKNYKKDIPEGIVYVLKHIRITKNISANFIFDGIRGEEELKNVLKTFKKAKIIILNTSKKVRLQRIIERKDPFDQINSITNNSAESVVENDFKLHGNFKNHKSEKILDINTDNMDQDEVYLTAYNWIIKKKNYERLNNEKC